MDPLNVWRKWLFVVSLCMITFGLLLAFCSQTPLKDFVISKQVDPVFELDNLPDSIKEKVKSYEAWMYGIVGAHVAAWGVLLAFVVHFAFKPDQRWAWRGIAVAITVWFVADTTVSAFYGVWFNVVFNTGIFLAVWIPLLLAKRYFPRPPDPKDPADDTEEEPPPPEKPEKEAGKPEAM